MNLRTIIAAFLTALILCSCNQVKTMEIELVPFSSQAFGIRGVRPDSWEEIASGQFSGDQELPGQLMHEAYPGMSIESVMASAILPRLGLDAVPESVGTHEDGTMAWDLYTTKVNDPNEGPIVVDWAVSETNIAVYVTALVGEEDLQDQLREAIFIPALQALEPMVFTMRDQVTVEELNNSSYRGDGPVNNAYFLPVGESALAQQELEGTLTVPEFKMLDTYPDDKIQQIGLDRFPGFSTKFFTYGDNLVPVERGVLLSPGDKSIWKIILSPGKVWSEASDKGMSRASFPFVLAADDTNETHNGVASFVFDEDQVSAFRFQITQETAAWRQVDYWGQSTMTYLPTLLEDKEALAAEFEEELSQKVTVRLWSDLEELYDPQMLSTFNGSIHPSSLSASGLVLDNILYLQPCHTRYGHFPYCESMRHGAFSVTKSMGAAVVILRLAQKYGQEVFDLKITDYVQVTADHDGWQEVTFGDVLNMATGIGDDLPEEVEPNVMMSDEEGDEEIFNGFLEARSAEDKAEVCFSAGDYPWGPGEVARYNSCHTFILAMAMDSFLKSKEGPDADIWEMVLEEVYRPIGIHHGPMMRTIEPDGTRGIPQFWVGLYPTADDVAKAAILLRNGGQHQGQQLLHAGKTAEALRQTDVTGLPTGEFNDYGEGAYHMSFWSMPYRSTAGDLFQIPYMSGFGGNRVIFNPNGIITFQFADAHIYGFESMVKAADGMEPFLGE